MVVDGTHGGGEADHCGKFLHRKRDTEAQRPGEAVKQAQYPQRVQVPHLSGDRHSQVRRKKSQAPQADDAQLPH